MSILIKDLQTGDIRPYGTDCHDSLRISGDGQSLCYYNLQNGDGSMGDYRFVMEDGEVPFESETADAIHGQCFFNIVGRMTYKEKYERLCKVLIDGKYLGDTICDELSASEWCEEHCSVGFPDAQCIDRWIEAIDLGGECK